jgi:hypothetical protein
MTLLGIYRVDESLKIDSKLSLNTIVTQIDE